MTDQDAERLSEKLREQFDARVDLERVTDNGRYRFAVTSEQFNGMPQMERQDLIWQVVDAVLSRNEVLDVSIILAYSPQELADAA